MRGKAEPKENRYNVPPGLTGRGCVSASRFRIRACPVPWRAYGFLGLPMLLLSYVREKGLGVTLTLALAQCGAILST